MELNLHKQAVNLNEVIYDGTAEQPLECDVLLPDYCPDIQKILRCEVTPSLLSSNVSGDRLMIDGMAVAHLYYVSEDGCIRHAEYKIPYTKAIELRCTPVNPTVTAGQNVDYFNCRAVSQRRLDMRGALTISAKVVSQSEEQVVCGAEGAGMQLCKDSAENAVMIGQVSRQMSVHEELELGYGKPSIGSVIRCSATAEVTDYKVISNKLVTKGELAVRVLYQCEEDTKKLEVMEYTLPISQVIDMEGIDEDCTCSIWYDITSMDISPKNNADGENRLFGLDISANACAAAQRRIQLDTACDCYSTGYECRQTQKQVPFLRLLNVVDDTCMYKETLDLPPNVKGLIDIWSTTSAVNIRTEQDCVVVSGKVSICMFVYENDDDIACYDQLRDFSQRIPIGEAFETLLFTPIVRAGNTAFTMSGHEKIEVRCPIRIKGGIYSQYRKKVICDIAVDESHPKVRQDNMLYLYYASESEPVWEIAKRYNTSVEAISVGNQLEGTTLEGRRMLLIPMR